MSDIVESQSERELPWTEKCPVCKSGSLKVTVQKGLFSFHGTNLTCNNCNAVFVPDGDRYKLTDVTVRDKLYPVWLEYNQQSLTPEEWKRISCGGMSGAKEQIGAAVAGNTSGQGSLAVIPPEIRGWNWGAFLLNWIWSIGNSVWLGLLTLIPYVGFVMAIVLGVKGSEWAWQKKKWDSIDHFKRTQRKWAWWGLGVVIAALVIVVIVLIFASATTET